MKKLLPLLLLLCLALTGCNNRGGHDVVVVKQDEGETIKSVTYSTNGYERSGTHYSTQFAVSRDDFITDLKTRALEKKLDQLDPTTIDSYFKFKSNAESLLFVSDYGDGIHEVEFSLLGTTAEDAKRDGEYIYLLIDMFNPEMQELISNELYIFDEPPKGQHSSWELELICGNTTYSYHRATSTNPPKLIIKATPLPKPPEPEDPSPIRPE